MVKKVLVVEASRLAAIDTTWLSGLAASDQR
jgi:hypothetical protein